MNTLFDANDLRPHEKQWLKDFNNYLAKHSNVAIWKTLYHPNLPVAPLFGTHEVLKSYRYPHPNYPYQLYGVSRYSIPFKLGRNLLYYPIDPFERNAHGLFINHLGSEHYTNTPFNLDDMFNTQSNNDNKTVPYLNTIRHIMAKIARESIHASHNVNEQERYLQPKFRSIGTSTLSADIDRNSGIFYNYIKDNLKNVNLSQYPNLQNLIYNVPWHPFNYIKGGMGTKDNMIPTIFEIQEDLAKRSGGQNRERALRHIRNMYVHAIGEMLYNSILYPKDYMRSFEQQYNEFPNEPHAQMYEDVINNSAEDRPIRNDYEKQQERDREKLGNVNINPIRDLISEETLPRMRAVELPPNKSYVTPTKIPEITKGNG